MKKFLVLILLTATAFIANAQIELTRPVEDYAVNKTTIVTNKDGAKYPYDKWSKLLATGNYKLKPVHDDSDSTDFILVKRDEQAIDKTLSAAAKPEESKFFKTGDPFKFLTLKDMDGAIIKPEDLQGKVVVINFWFIACPRCRYEMPELNRLVNAYQNNKDVVFIAISLDKMQNIERFLKVSPFNYRIIGNAMPLFAYYKVSECPVSLVIDKAGIIRFNSVGYGDGSIPEWIKKTIDEVK
ncbi:TlpA family protein disulfide reductase [Mucilaginibacter sp.]|uniref:TlpA family protein disulfide reductase n=1 Tax=Mucilaginibacter sp. TaxID=1882438 RepID=UPI003D0F193F